MPFSALLALLMSYPPWRLRCWPPSVVCSRWSCYLCRAYVCFSFSRFGLPSSDVWCCRSHRLGSAVCVLPPACSCSAVLVLAYALPPLSFGFRRARDAPLTADALLCWPWRMLCCRRRLGSAVCMIPPALRMFCHVGLVNALSPCFSSWWMLCHQVFCVVFFFAGPVGQVVVEGPLPSLFSFFRVCCSKPLSLWFVGCALGFSIMLCKLFFRQSYFFLMKYIHAKSCSRKKIWF